MDRKNEELLDQERPLTEAELHFATGGMKLDGVRESTNVIDARSGFWRWWYS